MRMAFCRFKMGGPWFIPTSSLHKVSREMSTGIYFISIHILYMIEHDFTWCYMIEHDFTWLNMILHVYLFHVYRMYIQCVPNGYPVYDLMYIRYISNVYLTHIWCIPNGLSDYHHQLGIPFCSDHHFIEWPGGQFVWWVGQQRIHNNPSAPQRWVVLSKLQLTLRKFIRTWFPGDFLLTCETC